MIRETRLHEAATSDSLVPAAKEMLHKAPTLLSMPNMAGEMAVFRAARYGTKCMYAFLDAEMNKTIRTDREDLRRFHFRKHNTSILHASILAEHFGVSTKCNSAAGNEGPTRWCRVPLWEEVRRKKLRYQSAKQLAMFLIQNDTSWQETQSALTKSKPKTHKYGEVSATTQQQVEKAIPIQEPTHKYGEVPATTQQQVQKSTPIQEPIIVRVAETPLFLATKSGCTEIVKGILKMYPQAVEHVDGKGRNILHVAIKYRQIQIFDIVEKMETPMLRLITKIDHNGNSILHTVGIKAAEVGYEDMRSPALVLREDLLLFGRVKKILPNHITKYYNSEGQTAEKLFAFNNAQLRSDAKEWMKDTAQNCSIVAVLIATVAFAAAYTIPGGPNQQTGYPILQKEFFFVIFTMTDVLSLAFALTSVIVFLSILTSPFRLKDFQQSLPQKLMLGVTLLMLSVSMMMMAFAATVILLIRDNKKLTRIPLYAVSSFPVLIFAFSYLRLYTSLLQTFTYSLKKVMSVVPRCSCSNPCKSSSTTPSNPARFSTPQTTRSLV